MPPMSTHLAETLKLRIDTETLRALERLARDGDRTIAAEVRRVLRKHVAEAEAVA